MTTLFQLSPAFRPGLRHVKAPVEHAIAVAFAHARGAISKETAVTLPWRASAQRDHRSISSGMTMAGMGRPDADQSALC